MNDALEQGTKHPGGRPLKFQSVEDLQKMIDQYFEVTPVDEWTWTGLALALDTSRETLSEYRQRPEFVDPLKRALLKIENQYEIDTKKHGRAGSIFALKNFGWRDRIETDVTTKDQPLSALQVPQEKVQEFASFLAQDMKKQG
jgi:hypothetical protein